jgi:hypothetical protein
MRMLRWINGNTRKARLRNEDIHLKIGVVPIDENMRESLLRWFSHVQRRLINAPVRKSELIQVEGTEKSKGRPKITLIGVVKITCQLRKKRSMI